LLVTKRPCQINVGLVHSANNDFKYPDKANVAYATLLSTDPEAIVGRVKTGNQFYKVCINPPIAKHEPLVRPMPRCNSIGDVHAKGVSIAWLWCLYVQTSFLNFTSMYIYDPICNVTFFFAGWND
jgi:hypothetical protein